MWGGTIAVFTFMFSFLFQSTHPMWGGTKLFILVFDNLKFQSTHSMWGGTPEGFPWDFTEKISIHPPHVGWDACAAETSFATPISIHPPHVGWDYRLSL